MPEREPTGWISAYRRWSHERTFYRVRVAILSAVLVFVVIYAVRDYSARHARTDWRRPLEVALVLLTEPSEPSDALDPEALAAFVARVPALEAALAREFERHGGSFSPIRFHVFGPVPQRIPPPRASAEPGLLEPLRMSYRLWRFARASNAASGVRGSFDGTIYVVLSPPRSARLALVEGLGQDGGRVAITRLELETHSVDFGFFVVAHELFHLLGASDRYAQDGSAVVPDGLGDPERDPLYPQDTVEVMARGRVIEPGHEEPPADLGELRVGHKTAAEIGWLERPEPP